MEHFFLLEADQLLMLLQKSQVVDDDPCQRLRQIFELVFFLFPTTPSILQQVLSVIQAILHDLENFGRQPEMQTRWSTYRHGQCILNFGGWFVQQEAKHVSDLSSFVMEGQTEHVRVMAQLTVNEYTRTLYGS